MDEKNRIGVEPKGSMNVTAPAKSFKSPVSTKECYGAAPPHVLTSDSGVPSNFSPYMLGNQHEWMQAYGMSVQSPPYNHKQLHGCPNGISYIASDREDKSHKDNALESMTKLKRNSESLAAKDNRLGEFGDGTSVSRNDGDDALPSAPNGIEDTSTESNYAKLDFPEAKKQRSNQRLLDGAVRQSAAERGVITESNLQGSEAETKILEVSLNRHSTKSAVTKDEHDDRKERRKQSNREAAKRSRLRKQVEYEAIEQTWKDLKYEISMYKAKMMWYAEECERLTEENKGLRKENREMEKACGLDLVADLKERVPGFAKPKNNSNGEVISSNNYFDSSYQDNEVAISSENLLKVEQDPC